MIMLKRAYDPMSQSDSRRFLGERLWRHGVEADRGHRPPDP
jgi:uncharacterized protein YeaO (DUF488 family)